LSDTVDAQDDLDKFFVDLRAMPLDKARELFSSVAGFSCEVQENDLFYLPAGYVLFEKCTLEEHNVGVRTFIMNTKNIDELQFIMAKFGAKASWGESLKQYLDHIASLKPAGASGMDDELCTLLEDALFACPMDVDADGKVAQAAAAPAASNGSQKEKDVGKAAADEAQAAAAPAANNGSQEEKGDGKAAAHKALPAIFASQKEKKGYGTAAEVAALEEEASDNDEVAAGAEESSDDKPTAEVAAAENNQRAGEESAKEADAASQGAAAAASDVEEPEKKRVKPAGR